MDLLFTVIILLSFAAWIWIPRALKRSSRRKLPPGPSPLPLIGNILSIGAKPHQSLAHLSQIHGPVMLLKLGSRTSVVISSPEAARAVLQKYDQACCNRAIPDSVRACDHHIQSVAWMQVGPKWRTIRKFCKEQMFSPQRLDSSHGLRTEKLQKLIEHVDECCASGRAVDIGKAAFTTSLNLMSASLFSVDVTELGSDSSGEFREIVGGMMEAIGLPNLSDYFPILRAVDPQGISRKVTDYFQKCFVLFDEIINQRAEMRRSGGDQTARNDMLEALLEFHREDDSGMTLEQIRHLLLDLFVAGSDTTSGTVEWAMTELIRRPDKMQKAKSEFNNVLNSNQQIQESDIAKLPYLQAIVKETLRLHPVVPLLLPHKAEEEIEINGYIIPENVQILVNTWAIGRDPNVWQGFDKFIPERFLDSKIDFKGQHFGLTPFGGGRRICLGLPLAHRMIHMMLATLIRNFDWKPENEMKIEDIDVEDRFGLSLQKANPLRIVPFKV